MQLLSGGQHVVRAFIGIAVLFCGVVFGLGGCGTVPNELHSVALTPRGTAAVDTVRSSLPQATTVVTTTVNRVGDTAIPTSSSVLTLTMWTTEAFSPLQNDLGSQLLLEQVEKFAAQNSGIAVDFVLKKAYGTGGIHDFLQTTNAVVPQRLPDLAIVDVADLPTLAHEGLFRSLDDLISQDLQADLFPFARAGCTVDDRLLGIQFEADLYHLAYDTALLSSPPLTWQQVLSGTATYVFAGGGEDGERVDQSFWLQYLALGEDNLVAGQNIVLDADRLTDVFDFYRQGNQRQLIPLTVLDYRTEADAWAVYLSGKAQMTDVSSLRYLSLRPTLHGTSFAPTPTRDGNLFSLTKGWALVIVAVDPERQRAAAQFIEWLMLPENNGIWTNATNRLSTTRQAMGTWDQSDPYVAFAQDLLERAAPYPAGANYEAVARALQRGLRDVLTRVSSPSDATTGVLGALKK